MPPRVTVVIPTHNDAPFIGAAIDSVLAQTFTDFELIVVDDASTDGTRAVVERCRDPRVRLLVNPSNVGGAATRNRGIAASSCAGYVALLDGNDLSFPERLERQVRSLDEHPDVAAVGAQAALVDVGGRRIGSFRRPVTENGIRWCRMFQTVVVHSSLTCRRSVLWDELGGYEEAYRFGEDFDLLTRLTKHHRVANLAEELVAYRVDPGSVTGTKQHPSRQGYLARKKPMILAALRETLHCEVAPELVGHWLALGDDTVEATASDVRGALEMIDLCASRFAEIYGRDADVTAHQTSMLLRVLGTASVTARALALKIWMKILRRDRAAALRTLPRLAATFLLGEAPLRVHRAIRQARADRRRAHASQ